MTYVFDMTLPAADDSTRHVDVFFVDTESRQVVDQLMGHQDPPDTLT